MKKKVLLIVAFLVLSVFCFADSAMLTANMSGTIKYLPDVGQIVKQGEPLIKFSTGYIDLEIEKGMIALKIKEEDLKDLKTDIARSRLLHGKSIVSLATLENNVLLYEKCLLSLETLKIEGRDLMRKYNKCILSAPFDCKIIKVFVIPNSGVELGQEILEVERVGVVVSAQPEEKVVPPKTYDDITTVPPVNPSSSEE